MALLKSPAERLKILLRSKLAGLFYCFCWWIFRPGTARHSGKRHCGSGRVILFAVAKRGHAINTGKVLRVRPGRLSSSRSACIWWFMAWQCRTNGISFWRTQRAGGKRLWAATLGTGFLTAFLSSIMNICRRYWLARCPLMAARHLAFQRSDGLCQRDWLRFGAENYPIGSLATLLWLHVLSQKNMTSAGDITSVQGLS